MAGVDSCLLLCCYAVVELTRLTSSFSIVIALCGCRLGLLIVGLIVVLNVIGTVVVRSGGMPAVHLNRIRFK